MAEDAALAVQYGIESIYLSNHSGRQCDDAASLLHTLIEIRRFYPRLFEQAEFFLDGRVRRGSDIVKALCILVRVLLVWG
jgi:L-lactate dehydrogenase (cytochrome)